MKKLLFVLALLLTLALVGCGDTGSEDDYDVTLYTQYKRYENFNGNLVICIFVQQPIWDVYYTMYGDVYEYEFYGHEVKTINITYQGTLEIIFKTEERTVIYDYVAIHFDN